MILYVDEAACYLLPFLSRTWSPRGQTPVITEKAGRDHLSLIAAMAPNGRLYVGGQGAAFNGADVVWFLEKLCLSALPPKKLADHLGWCRHS